jgi:hypothetical protein
MANRDNYDLELSADRRLVAVYTKGGKLLGKIPGPPKPRIPQYIRLQCEGILTASEFELARGYTLDGKPCRVDTHSQQQVLLF